MLGEQRRLLGRARHRLRERERRCVSVPTCADRRRDRDVEQETIKSEAAIRERETAETEETNLIAKTNREKRIIETEPAESFASDLAKDEYENRTRAATAATRKR